MAAVNKIEKYNLQNRVLALSGEGNTTHQIAAILTEEAEGRYSISQPTVSRWLKTVREDRAEQTKQLVHDHVKEHVPADLQALEDLESEYLAIFNNPEQYNLKDRMAAGDRIVKIIDTKLKYAGILENPDALPGGSEDPVDLDEFRSTLSEKKAVNG